MDLNFLYSDFVMDDKEVLFHSAPGTVSSFHDDEGTPISLETRCLLTITWLIQKNTPTVPVVQTPVRSLTPNNRSLSFLQTAPGEDVQVHNFQHRGAVASMSIASTDLLLHVGPLPMEQLILHDTPTVCGWPNSARGELSAVARRDTAVARRNLASMTQYVDLQDDHLAACEGGLDDDIPLMTVETFPRPAGGIQSVLDVVNRRK